MNNEEKILNALSQLNNRFDNLETRFDNLEKRFDNMEERFDNLEGQQKENITILRILEHRAEENSAKIEGMYVSNAKEFGEIKNKLTHIEEKIEDISLAISEHESAIFRLKRKTKIV